MQSFGQLVDCRPRERRVRLDGAPETPGADSSQYHVGVGDGRLRSTQGVAGGAGNGAGAAGADPEGVRAVRVRDAAAAGTDGIDVDLAPLDRIADEGRFVDARRTAVLDEAHVGAGAAHVAGHEIRDLRRLRYPQSAAHTADRTRQDGADGQRLHGLQIHGAAARGHRVDGAFVAPRGKRVAQRREIAPHDGQQVGVDDRGREALVLPELGDHLMGGGQGDAGRCPAKGLERAAFMVRTRVGMQKAHGERLDVGDAQTPGDGLDRRLVERRQDFAVMADALGDLVSEAAWERAAADERRWCRRRSAAPGGFVRSPASPETRRW